MAEGGGVGEGCCKVNLGAAPVRGVHPPLRHTRRAASGRVPWRPASALLCGRAWLGASAPRRAPPAIARNRGGGVLGTPPGDRGSGGFRRGLAVFQARRRFPTVCRGGTPRAAW